MSATPGRQTGQPDFLYLNRDNVWPDFERRNIDVVDGSLGLARLPALTAPLPAEVARLDPADEPAGLTVGPDGTIFFTDPVNHTVFSVQGCDGTTQLVPCLGGEGEEPAQLRDPRGLLIHPGRRALIVADAGNHRLQLFDLGTLQLLDIWGDAGPGIPPAPDASPGRFNRPSALAADPTGHVYVVDRGNARIQKFTPGGEVVPAFWQTLASEATVADPVDIAVSPGADEGEGPRIFILDRERKMLLVVDQDGHLEREIALAVSGDPLGLVVTGRTVYTGDHTTTGGQVLRLRSDGSSVGAARGYRGAVAALAIDGRGGLLVHPGWSRAPLHLMLDAAFVREGVAWGGPFGAFNPRSKTWQRLRATMTTLPKDAHVQFSVYTTNDPAAMPPVNPDGPVHFPAPAWSAGAPDLAEHLIRRPPSALAWVGIHFSGEGLTSPSVEQIQLLFDRPGYLEHLPAIYREDSSPDAFLPRFLSMVKSHFDEVEENIADLTRILDPAASPPFLAQLARWLAVDIAAQWDTETLRDAVANAYVEAAARGTASGLRTALRRATGVDAWIEEPVMGAAWWALAGDEGSPAAERETSILGVTTMLAAAEPQGAVLGSTATLDRSHLIEGDDYGSPLFESVAHRFTVRLYRGAAYSEELLRSVEALIEREKPAHTEFQICPVDAQFEIGAQARIGIDAIIGGDPLPSRLDSEATLGVDLVLGGDPPGQIGNHSQIGVTTLLGAAAVED